MSTENANSENNGTNYQPQVIDMPIKLNSKKKIYLLYCLCLLFIILAISFAVAFFNLKATSYSSEEYWKYREVAAFYLNHAGLTVDGDDKYYHRVDCPTFEDKYSYLMYNIEAAKSEGYIECPICFHCGAGRYVDEYL